MLYAGSCKVKWTQQSPWILIKFGGVVFLRCGKISVRTIKLIITFDIIETWINTSKQYWTAALIPWIIKLVLHTTRHTKKKNKYLTKRGAPHSKLLLLLYRFRHVNRSNWISINSRWLDYWMFTAKSKTASNASINSQALNLGISNSVRIVFCCCRHSLASLTLDESCICCIKQVAQHFSNIKRQTNETQIFFCVQLYFYSYTTNGLWGI